MGGELYVGVKRDGKITHYLTWTNWLPNAFCDIENIDFSTCRVLKQAKKSEYGVLCVDYDAKRVFSDNGYFNPGNRFLFVTNGVPAGDLWETWLLQRARKRGHVTATSEALELLRLCVVPDFAGAESPSWLEGRDIPTSGPIPANLPRYVPYQVQPPEWVYEHRNACTTSGRAAMKIMGWAK